MGANSDAKAATVVFGMRAGADSIEDLDVLRAGATGALLGQPKAPSTIGTWLREFTWAHLKQLDAAAGELLARLWAAGAGPHRLDGLLVVDIDSTIGQQGWVAHPAAPARADRCCCARTAGSTTRPRSPRVTAG